LNQILDDPIGVLVDRQVQWRESLLSQASSFVRSFEEGADRHRRWRR